MPEIAPEDQIALINVLGCWRASKNAADIDDAVVEFGAMIYAVGQQLGFEVRSVAAEALYLTVSAPPERFSASHLLAERPDDLVLVTRRVGLVPADCEDVNTAEQAAAAWLALYESEFQHPAVRSNIAYALRDTVMVPWSWPQVLAVITDYVNERTGSPPEPPASGTFPRHERPSRPDRRSFGQEDRPRHHSPVARDPPLRRPARPPVGRRTPDTPRALPARGCPRSPCLGSAPCGTE